MKIENGIPLMPEEMIPHEKRGWRPASLGECAAEVERLRAALKQAVHERDTLRAQLSNPQSTEAQET
jgi:hypothetical protein